MFSDVNLFGDEERFYRKCKTSFKKTYDTI